MVENVGTSIIAIETFFFFSEINTDLFMLSFCFTSFPVLLPHIMLYNNGHDIK